MGFFDYVSDLYSALTIEPVYAEAEAGGSGSTRSDSEDQKFASGDFNSGKDQRGGQSGGLGQAEQTRGATVKGGASTGSPASYEQESGDEAEANKADAKKDTGEQDGGAAGHRPGSGGEASGQVGPESAGPHGGAVGTKANEDEDEDEEEEEDEDEPKDLKPIIEEGESIRAICQWSTAICVTWAVDAIGDLRNIAR